MSIKLELDERYEFYDNETKYGYLNLINQGVIVKKDFYSVSLASKMMHSQSGWRRYVKILMLWFSVYFIPIHFFAKKTYMKNSNVKVFFMGRSNRKKIIKNKVIVNSINNDKFSKRDFYIRKKIDELGVSPKLLHYTNHYFVEELIENYKTSGGSDVVTDEVLLFKRFFKTLHITKNNYVNKLLYKINGYASSSVAGLVISKENREGDVVIRISHGDLIHKNIMVTDDRSMIIDFEFCAYRSECYDNYYEKYYQNRAHFFAQKPTPEIIIYCLERLVLVLSIQSELGVCYENEIKMMCDYLSHKENCS
ncbi:MAG: hypothetical protein V7785_21810 [Bermanella sp.]